MRMGLGLSLTDWRLGILGPPIFSAVASDWDGTGLPMGSAYLTNATASQRPTLANGRLVFSNDGIQTQDEGLIAIGQSGNSEYSIVYRPTAITTAYILSWGTALTNLDNFYALVALSTGDLRVSSDGNTSLNADSKQTSGLNMQVGTDYLITVTCVDWFVTVKVDGVVMINDVEIPAEDRPVGLSQFTLGCRGGSSLSSFCSGEITSFEARSI